MKIKTKASVTGTGIAVCLLLLVAVSAVDATVVSIEPNNQTVPAGQSFSVNVSVDTVMNLTLHGAILHFDPSAMQATAITEGITSGLPHFYTFEDIDNLNGKVTFTYALNTDSSVSGSGPLAGINFTADASANGTYNLNLTEVELWNESAVVPLDGVNNGTVNITAPAGPALCTNPDPPDHDFGDVPEGQIRTWTFDITNCGNQSSPLTWGVGDDQGWLSETPTSGSTTTETDTVTVRVDTAGLSKGLHTGMIMVTSNGGNKDGTITVNVTAPLPPPAAVPGLSGTGLIAAIGILATVLAISVSAMRRRRK